MKLIEIGDFAIRPENLIALSINTGAKAITIYCVNNQKYIMYYRTPQETKEEYKKTLERLKKLS